VDRLLYFSFVEAKTDSPVLKSYLDVPGWFYWYDRALFDALLESQAAPGDIVELGAYLARSAVILGNHLRPGERFVVVDLFGSDTAHSGNKQENERSYKTLTRQQFEANYLAFHSELPEVVQGLSTEIVNHVDPGSVRFMHIDASHLYDAVAEDIRNSRSLLMPDGVVVLDDFRSGHTPGVAAATWAAIVNDGLKPFATTKLKLYATWGDADRHRDVIAGLVERDSRLAHLTHEVDGHHLLQVFARESAKPAPAKKAPAKPAAAVKTAPAKAVQAPAKKAPPATLGARVRQTIARDIAPPALTRWVRKRRR
jgi:hypothetical protein